MQLDVMRALAIAVVALCGCDEPTPRLFSDEDIARYEAQLMEKIAANRARSCRRPVLHGTPLPGTAAEDIIAIREPTGELAECLQKARIGLTEKKPPKLSDLVQQRDPRVMAVEAECGAAFEAAITRAVAHEDTCSPYQTGVRTPFEDMGLTNVTYSAGLLTLRAQLRAEAGDAAGAIRLLLDIVRFGQDFSRGRVAIIFSVVGNAAAGAASRELDTVPGSATLSTSDIAQLATALDQLIATEPSFGDNLRADREYMALHYGLAQLKPPLWPVPGGHENRKHFPIRHTSSDRALLDQAAMFLAISVLPVDDDFCAVDASLARCWRDLMTTKLSDGRMFAAPEARVLFGRAFGELRGKDSPAKFEQARVIAQRRLFDELDDDVWMLEHYVAMRVNVVSQLVGARIALEVKRRGRCPTADELASPEWIALRSPAVLGDAVRATVTNGVLQIRPPAWAKDERKPPVDHTFSIPCPD